MTSAIEAFEEILRNNNKPAEELDEAVQEDLKRGRFQIESGYLHGVFALALNKRVSDQLRHELDQAIEKYKFLTSDEDDLSRIDHREMARKLRRLHSNGLASSEIVFFAHDRDIERHPGNYEAIAELGRTYFSFDTYESLMKASRYLMEALSINPEPSGNYGWINDMVIKEIPQRIAQLRKKGLIPTKK